MQLKFFTFILILPLFLFGQANESSPDTLFVKMETPTSSRVVLYNAVGAKQKFVSFADATDGLFSVALPENASRGMYRLIYNQETMDYVDFLYVGKSLSMAFNPLQPEALPYFTDSPENNQYYSYTNEIYTQQHALDSLQILRFQIQDEKQINEVVENYKEKLIAFNTFLNSIDTADTNPILKDVVIANTRVLPDEPIQNPEDYLPFLKAHYFDKIDFNNNNLIHSSILIDKAVDYVFYLTVSNDPHTQNELYKVAVTDVLQRMDDEKLRADFIQSFIQSFAKSENIVLTDYLFETFYNKISMPFQDKKFKTAMEQELKTAVGRAASDIAWQEAGKTLKLSEMEGYDYYVLMFWSTTCPHCMKEIPKLYDYTKDKNNIKVIAIGMETDESKTAWKSETYYYPTFSHILGIDKWDNPIAKAYNVFASPNYFILNADKMIIYKPYEMVDLEAFFDALENK